MQRSQLPVASGQTLFFGFMEIVCRCRETATHAEVQILRGVIKSVFLPRYIILPHMSVDVSGFLHIFRRAWMTEHGKSKLSTCQPYTGYGGHTADDRTGDVNLDICRPFGRSLITWRTVGNLEQTTYEVLCENRALGYIKQLRDI